MKEQFVPKINNPGKQEEADLAFLKRAKDKAQADAEKNFNLRSKKIILNDNYSQDQLLFHFSMKDWARLEPMLKKKFEFTSDGENITFTKVKEEQKK